MHKKFIVHICSNGVCDIPIVRSYFVGGTTSLAATNKAKNKFCKQTGKEVTLSWVREVR